MTVDKKRFEQFLEDCMISKTDIKNFSYIVDHILLEKYIIYLEKHCDYVENMWKLSREK